MPSRPDTDELLQRAGTGDSSATTLLFDRFRRRLRRMVEKRIDGRLAPRIDPSDVIQDALLKAHQMLPSYLKTRPMAFYPWLKRITTERLVDVHRRHVIARNRAVRREARNPRKTDSSTKTLADHLFHDENAAAQLIQKELRDRVQSAVDRLPNDLREVLILRFVERQTAAEIASMIDVAEGTVRTRQYRALAQLRKLLAEGPAKGDR